MANATYSTLDDSYFPKACGCHACQSVAKGDNGNNKEARYLDEILTSNNSGDGGGLSYAPTITATPTQFADYLINGFWSDVGADAFSWDTSNAVTFSISNSYSASQKDGIRMAFDQWADVANVTFSEVSSGGEINIITNNTGRAFSQNTAGYYQGDDVIVTANTISMDTSLWYWSNFDDIGDYALLTAIHEIGHSLGLGHTGNYNGSATYEVNAQFINDSRQYSVMSYFDADKTGSNHLGEYGSTPMIYDILAMQTIYGANNSIRSGNTTYGFNSNAGRDQFDFTINTAPVVAIWDGAGTDTIDVSGWSMTQMINLNDGEFSNVGGGTGNLAVAINARIENAIGGSGADTIYGNEWNNVITANNGSDIIHGSTGNDTINGGNGTDQVTYSYNFSDFTTTIVNSATVRLSHNSLGFTDTISHVENFSFNGISYTFAQLQNLVEVDNVSMTVRGSGWRIKHFNDQAGLISLTSDDAGLGGSTEYVSGTRADNTTLSLSNASGALISYVSDNTLLNLTFNGFRTSEAYMFNTSGVTIDINNSQDGRLVTGTGNDTITVDATLLDVGHRRVYNISTGDGDDNITYGGDSTNLYGYISAGAGNDTVNLTADVDNKVFGGDGDDQLNGHDGADILLGQNDNDTINGGGGNDRLIGGAGNDTLNGDAGDDRIDGQNGNDIIDGGTGNDSLYGGAGLDDINGGADNDFIRGDAGNDDLDGGTGNDSLYGGSDNDTITGGLGSDKIYGENGDDILVAIGDGDRFYGGAGADTFALTAFNNGRDRWYDFDLTEGDVINITDVLIGYTHGVDDINDFVSFNDRGSYTDMMISRDGSESAYQAVSIWNGNTLDGLSVNDLIASNDLIVNQTVL